VAPDGASPSRTAPAPAPLAVEDVGDLAQARAEWQRLADRGDNVFSTWEWVEAWSRHLGAGRPLRLLGVRAPDGGLLAILPLQLAARRPVRALRFAGHGPSDELGPVCAPEDRPAAFAALRRVLAGRPDGFGVFIADRVRDAASAAPLGARVVRSEPSPVLPVAGRSFDEFLAARSRNFREQVRRRERRLRRERRVRFRLTTDPAALREDVDVLVRLHDLRWRGRSDAFAGPLLAFHHDFAAAALERGWLRLWILEVDDQPAAAWYGFRFGGVESYYQAGRDDAYDAWSTGFVLLAHTVRAAFDDGQREYRFLIGDEPYKSRFTQDDGTVQTLAVAAGPLGEAAVAGARAARRLPPALRRRAAGLGG
jgi:CelD/BcsL family acetyltransferase involved in cellulose biosynthesis